MVYNSNFWFYNNIGLFFVIIFCIIFLLILIRPLYKFSKERTTLYILFSKTCINCFYQFISISQIIWSYIPLKLFNYYLIVFFVFPLCQLSMNAAYVHMTFLAINRFHAVFFAFNYNNFWQKTNIKYVILTIWLITIIWSAIQYTIYELIIMEHKDVGIFSIIQKGILAPCDLLLLTSLIISITCYVAVLAKLYYIYKKQSNVTIDNNNNKKRRLMLIICLVSTTPCLFLIVFNYINDAITNFATNSVEDETIILTIIFFLYNSIYILIQCIEEICLLIMSKDFRRLVKTQFIKNTQTNTATQVYVLQQRRIQLNSQHNNFVNNLQT